MSMPLNNIIGSVVSAGIRQWVRLFGKRVDKKESPWLDCPMGETGRIGAEFYSRLAQREHLQIVASADAGLIPDFDRLRGHEFEPADIQPEIRDFYEHTSRYHLEAWSEAPIMTRVFLWGLTRFVSRQMDQLNFPVSSLELSNGMTSEIIPMVDRAGELCYTGWLRRLASNQRVIYTGLYSVGWLPETSQPCIKVSFPLPLGSSTVFLRPEAQPDRSLKLISGGDRFGQSGFYRMVDIDENHWRVRYLRTLRETFHLYVDPRGDLRTDHTVRFLGFTPLRLHYKIQPKSHG
jgi:hypothetical protein